MDALIILAISVPVNLSVAMFYILFRNNSVYNMRTRILKEDVKLYGKLPHYDSMVWSLTPLKKIEKEAREKLL
jgi:hypothetical protein